MDDYEDLIDDVEDDQEQAQDMQDMQIENMESTYPMVKEKSDLYNWFWKVVRLNKPHRIVKVGNLTKVEIGDHGISVREAMNLAELGELFNHKKFGNYWRGRAVVTSNTSMAKDGWFMDLSISQRKVRERARKSSGGEEKWRMFAKKKRQEEGE